jgi:hypothetical protein
MLTLGELDRTFKMYWNDMALCRGGKAFWSLLHVTVCLPDICAALQDPNAQTSGKRYITWCDRYLTDAMISGEERYSMRCKILHEGRASINQGGRYSGFAFTQPAANGLVDHRRLEGTTLILEVGSLASEYEAGVKRWIQAVESNLASSDATTVEKNLSTIVQVRPKLMPDPSGVFFYNNRTS